MEEAWAFNTHVSFCRSFSSQASESSLGWQMFTEEQGKCNVLTLSIMDGDDVAPSTAVS